MRAYVCIFGKWNVSTFFNPKIILVSSLEIGLELVTTNAFRKRDPTCHLYIFYDDYSVPDAVELRNHKQE